MESQFIVNQLKEFYNSFEQIKETQPNYFQKLITEYNETVKKNSDSAYLFNNDLIHDSIIFRKLLLSNIAVKRDYFTISSKDSFSTLPTGSINYSWGKALIYHPLNDHSRRYLKKGDVLFCYRQGQFANLDDALVKRGIYAIGVAASEPIELFPNEEKHNKWGVLVCFPIQLPKHLELKNIQMHPDTIDLTPYNGNRNDALQHIPDEKHYLALLEMIYSKNIEIGYCFKNFFPEISFSQIELPEKILADKYHKNENLNHNSRKSKIFILEKFIDWFKKPENYKKSYEGLVNVKVLSFWDELFFKNLLFSIDLQNLNSSLLKLEQLISDKSNLDWFSYSEATSKGSPEAVLGKNNYLKFLSEFIKDENNINLLLTQNVIATNTLPQVNFNYLTFCNDIKLRNLNLSNTLVLRFVASLLTKPFVILTGLSGSGKTKLAQAFARWLCDNENQFCIVPVGADWSNREPLLGFPNALVPGQYVKPENKVLDLIIEANNNTDKPYFLILDEMNLSHVERYFADFLSVMESQFKISLHPDDGTWNEMPSEISLPKNLFIIGTVNIDETTYMFSPKVLDRANVIEFRVTEVEMKNYLSSMHHLDMVSLKGNGSGMENAFTSIAKAKSLEIKDTMELQEALLSFFNQLKKVGAEFGFRSASEILRFSAIVNKIEPALSTSSIIDFAIMQKLLPKVHGSRRKLEPILKTLGGLCCYEDQYFIDLISTKHEIDLATSSKVKYPISLEKILRMYQGLLDNGFTSYAEA